MDTNADQIRKSGGRMMTQLYEVFAILEMAERNRARGFTEAADQQFALARALFDAWMAQ